MREEREHSTYRSPEYSGYRDQGCALSHSCLKCPLPRCRHDAQADGRQNSKGVRNREILSQIKVARKSVAELAESYGVSKRTIQRIIRRSSNEQHGNREA